MKHVDLYPLTRVADGIGPDGVALFIGDQIAASDDRLLRENAIVNVLNCAVNCDINYVDQTLDIRPDGALRAFGHAGVRVAKVGMVDGDGNDPMLMLAAVHVLHGMLCQTFPQKNSYPLRQSGNVLVHCRGGRSRSVAVAGLYLHRMHPQRWPSFQGAIDELRTLRGIPEQEFEVVPSPGIIAVATVVLGLFDDGKGLIP